MLKEWRYIPEYLEGGTSPRYGKSARRKSMEAGEEDRAAMKLIYATDPHGDRAAYGALADLAERERADALVLGGDLFAYSRCAAPQIAFADGPFLSFLRLLAGARIPVLTIPGNVDVRAAVERVREFEREGLIRILGPRPIHLPFGGDERGGVDMIGYPYVPPTPFRLKENERRDLATDRYQGPWPIFLSSPDPAGERIEAPEDYLDRLPSIEEDLARIPTTERPCILNASMLIMRQAQARCRLGHR